MVSVHQHQFASGSSAYSGHYSNHIALKAYVLFTMHVLRGDFLLVQPLGRPHAKAAEKKSIYPYTLQQALSTSLDLLIHLSDA